ncbi:hypothetical protein SCUP515_00594 [Seiridium cupressi]
MLSSFGMATAFAHGVPRLASPWPPAVIRCSILFALWPLLDVGLAQGLPYIPTTILLPNSDLVPLQQNVSSDLAYIFSPQDDSVALLALNISSTVKSSSLAFQTLSSELPFVTSGNTSYTPTIANNGTLIVFAGDCSSSSSASVWTLDPRQDGSDAVWTQDSTGSETSGPGFLGAGLSFSTTLEPIMDPMDVYLYGGMCPSSTTSTTSSQSDATYSNQMVKLSPSSGSSSSYAIQTLTNKGSPIAEAGFTLTGLSPSISNRSGTVTQQTNYVVLGGHTKSAFVNISTAAIWSLPEESWGYVSISTASSSSTELAIKSTSSTIDPRSGHTAVLNEDGSALVVFGGWVGDTQTAASPQLAILNIGPGYGGSGEWQWTIPDTQPSGSGIYGHGAALLPGNIMMVYGGYEISSSGSRLKRQTTSSLPSFLNLTSMTWSEDYTNPTSTGSSVATSTADEAAAKRRLGLGLGLGLGIGAILLAVLAYFCYGWRRRKYSSREDIIRSLAQDTNHFLQDEPMMEREDGQGMGWYTGGHDPYITTSRSLGYQSLQGGRGSMDGGTPLYAPAPIIRKPIATRAARGQYQPTPTSSYDPPSGGRQQRSGAIHPIYEADEEANAAEEPISPIHNENRESTYSDPFTTPTTDRPISFPPPSRASQSPSPEGRLHPDPDVQDWMSDVDAADALLTGRMATHSAGGGGRSSPTRRNTVKSMMSARSGYNADDDSRTNSNLSESSRNMSRSGSQRSHFRSGFGSGAATTAAEERTGTSSSEGSQPSYHTAKSIPTLQAEGPSLLMGRREGGEDDSPGSPSKNKPRLSRGWLGSLRRVFSGPTPSPSPPGSRDDNNRDSMAEASDYDPRLGGLGGIAAGGLFRRKGGRGAWEAEDAIHDDDLPLGRRVTGERQDDEWDIEKAVENRLVQVMFTVPKERLRVVNGEPDIESAKSVIFVDPESEEREELEAKKKYELRDEPSVSSPAAVTGPNYGLEDEASHEEETILDKGKQRETVDSALGSDMTATSNIPTHCRDTIDSGLGAGETDVFNERAPSGETEGLLSAMETRHDSTSSNPFLGTPSDRHLSHDSHHSDAPILSAQAVELKRPERAKTRVLAMVESIESRSRSVSPERS